jgi:hypothetical protein
MTMRVLPVVVVAFLCVPEKQTVENNHCENYKRHVQIWLLGQELLPHCPAGWHEGKIQSVFDRFALPYPLCNKSGTVLANHLS